MIKHFFRRYKEVLAYIIVGGLTTLVSLGSYYLLVLIVFDPTNPWELQITNIISWICSVTFAFITNRKYVFNSTSNINREMIKFYGGRITTLIFDMALMFVFVTMLHMSDKLSKILVQIFVFITNYLISKFFVFKKDDTKIQGQP